MKREVKVIFDTELNQLESFDGIYILAAPIPGIQFREIENLDVETGIMPHKQLVELIDKGLSADDILELRKQGVV